MIAPRLSAKTMRNQMVAYRFRYALLAVAIAGSLFCAAACARIPIAEPDYEGTYGLELKSDTRKAAIYQGLETRLFVHVAWLKPGLVQAQAHLISDARAEPPDLTAKRLADMTAEDEAPTFFAVVYTPVPTWNDWDSKATVWRIALQTERGEIAPASVKRFEPIFNAEMVSLYPFLDDFVTGYRIQFPKGTVLTGDPKLLIAGTLGKVELDWSKP